MAGFRGQYRQAEGHGSVSEVVRKGLRLVEEREAKLSALRETLNASIERGGEYNDEDVDAVLEDTSGKLTEQGY